MAKKEVKKEEIPSESLDADESGDDVFDAFDGLESTKD
jgi:hypothetical protein